MVKTHVNIIILLGKHYIVLGYKKLTECNLKLIKDKYLSIYLVWLIAKYIIIIIKYIKYQLIR